MAGESISIPILTPGADAAARNIKQVGNASAETAAKLDVAAASLEAFNLAAAKSAKADATMVQSSKTHAKALGLVDDAYRVLDGKATQTTKLMADQGRSFDTAAKKASGLGARFSALAGTGGAAGGGMGALIGAGVVLSPVIATVGTGLAGLGAAAYGVAKPIENAAQKTGGLRANLKLLDPEQRAVARSLLGLGAAYGKFEQALKPEVLGLFNTGIRIAGHLMHDVQPVAQATGKALDQMLLSVDKEFQSGTWQQFFGFMAKNAAPDMQLLTANFADLLNVLPPLIQDLQPLARGLLVVSDDAIKATGGIQRFYDSFQKNVPVSNQHTINFLRDLDQWTVDLTNHIPGARAVNSWITGLQHALTGAGTSAQQAAPQVQHAAGAMGQWKTVTEQVVTVSGHLGRVTDVTTSKEKVFTGTTQSVIAGLKEQAKQLNIAAAGYEHALGPLGKYIDAQIAERNDLVILNQDLKKSHDAIGLKTQAERDSYAAARIYIDQTLAQGNAALAAHKGIDAQISSIQHALPHLEAVRGKTAAYKQELDLLKGILDKLRREKQINEIVKVTGAGQWSFQQSGVGHAVSPGGAAAGAYITGGVPGRDSVPIMAMPGEVVVPTKMVSAGAVDHLRGSIPGFASGGIVPSYHGGVAGLPPWTSHNQQATIEAVGVSIARAMASAFASAGFGAPGPGGGAPAANAALARRMMPAWGSGAEWAAWNYVAMRESGWSQFARNPSSGAYGIPQALPPSKMGPAANPPQSNPAAQISWMIGYIRGRYGDPIGAAAHERAFNWYGNGLKNAVFTRPTLIGVGERGPELVNVTPAGRGGGAGTVINLNVSVGHGTHPVAAAQEIVKLLNQGAKAGVRVRSSILGPG